MSCSVRRRSSKQAAGGGLFARERPPGAEGTQGAAQGRRLRAPSDLPGGPAAQAPLRPERHSWWPPDLPLAQASIVSDMGNHRDPGPQPPASGSRAGLLVSTSECQRGGEGESWGGRAWLRDTNRENEAGVHTEGQGATARPLLRGHHHEEGLAPKLHDCVSL